jgi:PKD repeat protein
VTVTAPPPNNPPTAAFTVSCTDGACDFDGSGSSDPDGTIATYAWDFGDGGSASTPSPSHGFVATGTYTVGLTVTDNKGATDTETQQVAVTVPVAAHPLGFVGAANSASGSAKFKAAVVPADTQAGDTMLLWLTTPSTVTWTGPTGVTGWTQVDSLTNGTIKSTLWRKVAEATDAGNTVRVDDPTGFRLGTLAVAVYRNADPAGLAAAKAGDTGTSTHVTPTSTATAGSWVVSYWSDKSATTTSWAEPSTQTVRREVAGDSGTTRFSLLLTDSGGPVAAGQVGGLTATSSGTSDKGAMWTVVLRPVS